MAAAIGFLSMGLVLGLGALGSALGCTIAGNAAAGAWAAEGKAGRPLSFTFIILSAAPISQTLYAMILMKAMHEKAVTVDNAMLLLGVAIGCGLGEFFSAYCQGQCGAAGIRTLNENGGRGFVFLLVILGIVETVGIFAMVFGLDILNKAAPLVAAAEVAVGS